MAFDGLRGFGLSWKPKLDVSADDEMIVQRPDGSDVRPHTASHHAQI